MQVEVLRAALHEAIDEIIDGFLHDDGSTVSTAKSGEHDDVEVVVGEDHGPFTYRWPGGNEEEFTRSRSYTVANEGREHRVLVAWTEREAWGRIRGSVPSSSGVSGTSLYPWTEFVETDDGDVAAGLPDPDHPRALLKHGSAIPDRFASATIERTDALFEGIRNGPSLRLVLAPGGELEMVRHGYWVAGLRKRR